MEKQGSCSSASILKSKWILISCFLPHLFLPLPHTYFYSYNYKDSICCFFFHLLSIRQVSAFKYYNYVNVKMKFFWWFCSCLLSSSSHLEFGDLWPEVLFCFTLYKVERTDFILPTRFMLLCSSHQRQLLALHFDQAPFKVLCHHSWISMASISATRLEICIRAF